MKIAKNNKELAKIINKSQPNEVIILDEREVKCPTCGEIEMLSKHKCEVCGEGL